MVYSITLYVDNGGASGHMYVGLTNQNNQTTYYGYYPKNRAESDFIPNSLPQYSGPGIVKNNDDSTRNAQATYSKNINITQSQYQNAQNKAVQIQKNPGQYNAAETSEGGMNCVGFANEVLKAAGFYGGIGRYFTDEELSVSWAGEYADLYYGDGSLWENIWNAIKNAVGNVAAGIGNFANSLLSPIALDLNGNGKIDTIYHNASTNKAYFDMDNDGFREKVQWLTPNADGWLARNININSTNDNFVLDVQKIAS